MQTNLFYLSLGSNMGNKKDNLGQALKKLSEVPAIKITGKSSIYQTEPFGYLDQDFFLNAVLALETALEPEALLNITQDIEKKLGRKRTIHWGPRTVDIDILLFNDDLISTPNLEIPHPQMHLRRFVLVPLAELNPSLIIPNRGEVKDILAECTDEGKVFLAPESEQW